MQLPRGHDTFSWEVYKFAIPDEARNNTYLGGIAIDITEQQALAEERDRLFSRLRLLFDRLPIGCIVTDPDLIVNEWNPAAEQIFGFTKDECSFAILSPRYFPQSQVRTGPNAE